MNKIESESNFVKKNNQGSVQISKETRTTEEEALMMQDYASAKKGEAFSEKQSEQDYLEAEKLVEMLKDKKFDWLNIDWGKIDLKSTKDYYNLEKRLNAAVQEILKSQEKSTAWSKLQGIYMPLVLCAALLISGCTGKIGPEIDSTGSKYKERLKRKDIEVSKNIEIKKDGFEVHNVTRVFLDKTYGHGSYAVMHKDGNRLIVTDFTTELNDLCEGGRIRNFILVTVPNDQPMKAEVRFVRDETFESPDGDEYDVIIYVHSEKEIDGGSYATGKYGRVKHNVEVVE
jgi:hypothetical protein